MASMRSDYDQRQALTALLKTNDAVVDGDAMVAAIGHMQSSYDKRMVLAGAIERGGLSGDAKKNVLVAAAGMQSDYDRSQILSAYVKAFGVEPAAREPFFAALGGLKSDYERRQVLTGVAGKGAIGREVQQAALDSITAMKSDYDRAETLLAFVQGVDPANRAAFVAAAERIRSAHDQDRVLAALVRAERR
jgi:hypothetical protein